MCVCARASFPSSQVCLGVLHFRGQKFKGHTPRLNFYTPLRNWDKRALWSSLAFGVYALAEMKAEKLVENDFLVAASTFNFLNWFSLPAEVRVCRHKTNWFQILIPLTAEQSRALPTIDLQSIQTQLMCWRPMGGGGGPRSFLGFILPLFSLLLNHSQMMLIALLSLVICWMMLCPRRIFSCVCNYFISSALLLQYVY